MGEQDELFTGELQAVHEELIETQN
jgi:hypothetical protein